MNVIDLRSDTVTVPTAKMREAMAAAEVGDDVYGEDPTVNALEKEAAEVCGKEAALFVPTGTMGNTIAIKLLTEPGQEVIAEARGHLLNYELSMTAWFAHCLIRPIAKPDGILTWADIRKEYRPLGPHWAPTGCIEIENTHNMAGGTVYPQETIDEICAEAHKLGLRVHVDGARIFNAAAAAGQPVSRIVRDCDTVMFCLSKGLGAPVGSMLVGTQRDRDRGRLYRKRLGGGMRQAGILAAAGRIALHEMSRRLSEDHANARYIAERLSRMPGIEVQPEEVVTNIVVFGVAGTGRAAGELRGALLARQVLINPIDAESMRAVTHHQASREDCVRAMDVFEEVLRG